jgi:hypothetical protein|tara:strand:- start:53840 stop:54388 length:549 start_codon:yes stop_codon:yes gene_type:complete
MHIFDKLILVLASSILFSSMASAEDVEIYLVNKLDGNLNHYCVDMLGFQDNADVTGNLQTHTCYSYQGQLAVDQKMPLEELENGKIHLYNFEVCASINGTNGGSTIGLAECSDDEMQEFTLTDTGNIVPTAAPSMCFTSGIASWAGGRNGDSPHQIRTLNLQPCSDEAMVYQRWGTRVKMTD